MDRRKNNGGNSTKSSRPDDKRLNPFKDAIRNACSEQDVIDVLKMLYDKSIEKKDTRAAKIYLEYCLGKPKEQIEVTQIEALPIFNLDE